LVAAGREETSWPAVEKQQTWGFTKKYWDLYGFMGFYQEILRVWDLTKKKWGLNQETWGLYQEKLRIVNVIDLAKT
jgi:hypothetical protein